MEKKLILIELRCLTYLKTTMVLLFQLNMFNIFCLEFLLFIIRLIMF